MSFALRIRALKNPENLSTVKITCYLEQVNKFRKIILYDSSIRGFIRKMIEKLSYFPETKNCIPCSSIKGKLSSITKNLTNFLEEKKDTVLLYCAIESSKIYSYYWIITFFRESLKYFYENTYYKINYLITLNGFKIKYHILPENKKYNLEQINLLKLWFIIHICKTYFNNLTIIKNVFYLMRIQYLSKFSVILYVMNKMKLKLKLFYNLLDTVYNFESIASVPP